MSDKAPVFFDFQPGTAIHIISSSQNTGKSLYYKHFEPYMYKGPMPYPVCDYLVTRNNTKPETFTFKILKNREFPRRKVANAIMELEV